MHACMLACMHKLIATNTNTAIIIIIIIIIVLK